jgi:YjbE family integral membrane protein
MELSDPQFWFAVLQIIAIDILLGGDNAVVIALACRKLPEHQRARGIMWGVVGAVALRILLLFFAVQVLALPYLKLVGAVLLLWIGIKLLLPDEEAKHGEVAAATSLGGAIKTIVVADAVMSLDNVVAVAGAARGEFLLIVFGIAVSVPIIVWGSRFVLRLMDRFPIVITLGAALLGWISGEMAMSDVALKPWVEPLPHATHYVAALAGALFVVIVGKLIARSRTRARVVAIPAAAIDEARPSALRVLIPVDDSESALRAADHVVRSRSRYAQPLEVHLVTVQHPISGEVSQFVGANEVREFLEEEGQKTLSPVRDRLASENIAHVARVSIGDTLPSIADYARRMHIDKIVIGSEGGFDHLVSELIDQVPAPVLLVK